MSRDAHNLIREYAGEYALVLWDRDVPPEFEPTIVNDWLPGTNRRVLVEVWGDEDQLAVWLGDRWCVFKMDVLKENNTSIEYRRLTQLWRERYWPPGITVDSVTHLKCVEWDKYAIKRCHEEGMRVAGK